MKNNTMVLKVTETALLAALAYIAFQFFKIPITLPGGSSTYFHLGNTFAALGAMLIGGIYGGLAGGIGLALADLTSGEPIYAVTTFFLKLIIGLVTGLVAHKIGHINEKNRKEYFPWSIIAPAIGLGVNIITDPVVGFLRNKFLFGLDTDLSYIAGKLTAGVTFVNAILSCICVVILYNILRPALGKAGLLPGVKK
ncbi:MAG: ECF transporter S component [Lachnospiraceae bacterium]|nr:ECF transporter S component [Lachnospiraceae bacterium]